MKLKGVVMLGIIDIDLYLWLDIIYILVIIDYRWLEGDLFCILIMVLFYMVLIFINICWSKFVFCFRENFFIYELFELNIKLMILF